MYGWRECTYSAPYALRHIFPLFPLSFSFPCTVRQGCQDGNISSRFIRFSAKTTPWLFLPVGVSTHTHARTRTRAHTHTHTLVLLHHITFYRISHQRSREYGQKNIIHHWCTEGEDFVFTSLDLKCKTFVKTLTGAPQGTGHN